MGLSNCRENLDFKIINNPGAYIGQKKSKININKETKLNQHFKQLFNSETFIDNHSSHLYLKVYDKKNVTEQNQYLDRLHIDRSRNRVNLRCPMKFTTIICHNDSGAINFPFGICENKTVDKIDCKSYELDTQSLSNKNKQGWDILNRDGCGLKISSKPGRIILFASSDKNNIPLYRSLHQGVDDVNNNEARMISVVGWDGIDWETGGYHEFLEHETFEMRASFFNRTIEEELVGVSQNIDCPRRGEALSRLNQLAINRNTTIENLISQVINNNNNNSNIQKYSYTNLKKKIVKPKLIYENEDKCPICFGEFKKNLEDINIDKVTPGYLSCGHILCEICYNEMKKHTQLTNYNGDIKCMSCRNTSTYWKSLTDLESSA